MIFDKLLTTINNGDIADILTIVESSLPDDPLVGKMMIVADGNIDGVLEKEFMRKLLITVQGTVWINPVVICLNYVERNYRIFWDRVTQRNCAVVLGGGHISQPLVQMLALLDFAVTVIDDRPEFANQARFPGAETVICNNFQTALESVIIHQDTAVIIVTRGHRFDLDCLRSTMCSSARYLGMIGSRKRIRDILQILEAEGTPQGLKERLRAPIGLDIKAQTPAEIAISIAAEVVSVFRGGSGRPLSKEEVLPYGSSHNK